MLGLTRQERNLLIFVLCVACAGTAIRTATKVYPAAAVRLVEVESRLGKISLNDAAVADLIRVPGLTRRLAERIAAYRAQRGRFHGIGELKNIKGIGPKRYAYLKEVLYVE